MRVSSSSASKQSVFTRGGRLAIASTLVPLGLWAGAVRGETDVKALPTTQAPIERSVAEIQLAQARGDCYKVVDSTVSPPRVEVDPTAVRDANKKCPEGTYPNRDAAARSVGAGRTGRSERPVDWNPLQLIAPAVELYQRLNPNPAN